MRNIRSVKVLNYPKLVRSVICDVCSLTPQLRNIRASRILVSSSHTKIKGKSGVWAGVVPLRFENGKRVKFEKRNRYQQKHTITIPPIKRGPRHNIDRGDFFLYYLYLSVPRFFNLTLEEKLQTIIHELYHVHPNFNGDLRRFEGRYYIHGPSIKSFDQTIDAFCQTYLTKTTNRPILKRLALNHTELLNTYDRVEFPHYQQPQQYVVTIKRS